MGFLFARYRMAHPVFFTILLVLLFAYQVFLGQLKIITRSGTMKSPLAFMERIDAQIPNDESVVINSESLLYAYILHGNLSRRVIYRPSNSPTPSTNNSCALIGAYPFEHQSREGYCLDERQGFEIHSPSPLALLNLSFQVQESSASEVFVEGLSEDRISLFKIAANRWPADELTQQPWPNLSRLRILNTGSACILSSVSTDTPQGSSHWLLGHDYNIYQTVKK